MGPLPKTVEACDKRLAVLSSERAKADGNTTRIRFLLEQTDAVLDRRLELAQHAALARAGGVMLDVTDRITTEDLVELNTTAQGLARMQWLDTLEEIRALDPPEPRRWWDWPLCALGVLIPWIGLAVLTTVLT